MFIADFSYHKNIRICLSKSYIALHYSMWAKWTLHIVIACILHRYNCIASNYKHHLPLLSCTWVGALDLGLTINILRCWNSTLHISSTKHIMPLYSLLHTCLKNPDRSCMSEHPIQRIPYNLSTLNLAHDKIEAQAQKYECCWFERKC